MGKVLVIADRDGVGKAVPRGLHLARELGLEVEVYAFVHAPLGQLKLGGDGRADVRRKLLGRRQQELSAFLERHGAPGQRVKLQVVWEKDVAHWVCKRCDSGRYDLVIKTGNRSETLVHTSTDWTLLRECPAPVLIVAEDKWRRTRPVLAALDLASGGAVKKKLNDAILGRAVVLAQAMEVELDIIAAVEVPTLLQDLDLVDPRAYVAAAREAMAPQIRALARRYGLAESAFRVKRGPVEKVISSEAARRRAQIVVMGCVGRRGVRGRVIGNTAERVLRHLRTDVLALKP